MIAKTAAFAFLVLVCVVARSAAQTVGPVTSTPICAAMCDSGAGPVLYRVGGDVSQPKVLRRVEPEYPEEARAASISGTVAVSIEIRPDGIAHNIRVTRSSRLFLGQGSVGLASGLDQNAIDAIRQWSFQPAAKNGQPVTVEATIELTFRPLSAEHPSSKDPDRIKTGQTKAQVSAIMGQPPQTKGHGHKETWFYEIGPEEARYVLVVEFVDGKVTRSHALVTDAKRQKEAEKNAAKEAARAAVEASDHLTVPLSGWISQTASGEAGCLALHDMAFRRDAQRGWGGLLGGGRNAYLGVSSNLVGVVTNTCTRELLVSIYGKFFNSSGLLLGQGSLDILVPASESRAFQVPWACSDGANYIGTGSTIWIPNCPADTARYSVRYE